MMKRIAVIGAGAWGTTLANLLSKNGNQVCIWAKEEDVVDSINSCHENTNYLPNIKLSGNLSATDDFSIAIDNVDFILIAVPSRWMRATMKEFTDSYAASSLAPILTVTKGLEIETGKRMSVIIAEELQNIPAIAALSGPNLAPEIAKELPAATTIASNNLNFAKELQSAFANSYFRVYTSSDIIGLEICGAVKNVIAIAAGISEGLHFGDSARAALLTRAVTEISRLVAACDGSTLTVAGLSGIGDLIATCSSNLSRNHRVGLALAKGEDCHAGLKTQEIAEGVPTTEAVVNLAKKLRIEMPICAEVYAIIFNDKNAKEAVSSLMSRSSKPE